MRVKAGRCREIGSDGAGTLQLCFKTGFTELEDWKICQYDVVDSTKRGSAVSINFLEAPCGR